MGMTKERKNGWLIAGERTTVEYFSQFYSGGRFREVK